MLPLKALDLRMAIRMLRPFAGLASGLQAVVGGLQAIRYNPITDRAAHDLRFGGHSAHTRRWCSVKNEQGRCYSRRRVLRSTRHYALSGHLKSGH